MYLKHVITAGILSAALALGPGAAFGQTSGSSSGTSPSSGSQSSGSQGTSSQGSSTQGSTSSSTTSSSSSNQQQSGSGGPDQEAVRKSLTGAREALAELTKLPAASQLQGDSRQRIAQFISDFNSFATATTRAYRTTFSRRGSQASSRIPIESATHHPARRRRLTGAADPNPDARGWERARHAAIRPADRRFARRGRSRCCTADRPEHVPSTACRHTEHLLTKLSQFSKC